MYFFENIIFGKRFLCIMNRTNMCIQITFMRKHFVTKFTFKRLLPVMYRSNMKTQRTFLRTLFLTKSTYKRILCIMNITNMCIQITFMRKHLSQNSHSKSLMNWGNMKTHATFLRKGFLTKSTYKRFLWIMNRTKMCIQTTFFEKLLSQNSHSKGFFLSCTEVTWKLGVLFW